MRVKLLFIAIILALTCSCSNLDEVQKTTKDFLEGYYSYDFESIYDISSPHTLVKVKDIESRLDESIDLSTVAIPEIIVNEYYIEGDVAYCWYTLKQDVDDTNAMSEKLKLIKIGGKWLVEY